MFENIGGLLWQLVLPALISALVGALLAIAKRAFEAAGFKLTQQQLDVLKGWIEWAVRAVEERARRQVKEGGPAMTAEEKAAAAFALVEEKLPKVEKIDIVNGIDAALPQMREELKGQPPTPSNPSTFGR